MFLNVSVLNTLSSGLNSYYSSFSAMSSLSFKTGPKALNQYFQLWSCEQLCQRQLSENFTRPIHICRIIRQIFIEKVAEYLSIKPLAFEMKDNLQEIICSDFYIPV